MVIQETINSNVINCEAGYVTANLVVGHLIWLRNMMKHLRFS
jgi:hypothetical protein